MNNDTNNRIVIKELLDRVLELEHRLTRHEMKTSQTQMSRTDLSHKIYDLENECKAQNQLVRDQGRIIEHLERVVEGLKRATDDLACQKKIIVDANPGAATVDDDDDCVNNDELLIRYPAPWSMGDGWTRWMRSNAHENDQEHYIAILKDGGILSINDVNNRVSRQYRYGRP